MKRGMVFVRAKRQDGTWGKVDALDLDDSSFRAFVLDMLVRAHVVVAIREDAVEGPTLEYQERSH